MAGAGFEPACTAYETVGWPDYPNPQIALLPRRIKEASPEISAGFLVLTIARVSSKIADVSTHSATSGINRRRPLEPLWLPCSQYARGVGDFYGR